MLGTSKYSTGVDQSYLLDKLIKLFPGEQIQSNDRSNFKYTTSNAFMELDIIIKKFNICFEFQDPHHYVTTWFFQRTRAIIQQKDNIKYEIAHQNDLTLIRVPCWWDGDIKKLQAAIHFQRPDLFSELSNDNDNDNDNDNNVIPISLNPPYGFFNSREIPGVGELMVAAFPEDEKFNKTMQDNTWWLGEKYDGVRFCWNPHYKTVYSRSARELSILPNIIKTLPSIFVEGELWFGRGDFLATSMLTHSSSENVQWTMLRMLMFDVPSYDYHNITFEKRYESLLSCSVINSPSNQVVFRVLNKNNKHLKTMVEGVIDDDGEGVILRQVKSLYENGRSSNLVKLKTTYGDAEGIVVKHGPHKSLVLELPDGKKVAIPSNNILIPMPNIGEIVSFSYEKKKINQLDNNNNNNNNNMKVFRVRHDISWNDVVYNAKKEKKYFLNDCSRSPSFNVHPIGHLMVQKMKLHLENFAHSKNLNPFLPSTWYKLIYDAVQLFPSGKAVLSRFNGSYYKLLRFVFPELKFDKLAFPETEQMRKFFERYAQTNGFDPRVPDHWYLHYKKRLLNLEGANRIKFMYNNSVPRALLDLFPDIGFDKAKFKLNPLWHKARYRRKFFEDYAKENGFDHRVPENWYLQSKKKINAKKGASRVMYYHNNSISRALIELFPNIGLDESLFPKSNLWMSLDKSKEFLENFAKEHTFDPRVSENWYSRIKEIKIAKQLAGVKFHRNKKVSQILMEIYPNIGLDKAKFPLPILWEESNRRKFFEDYAAEHGFDPLNAENWYSHSRKEIETRKGASRVLYYYHGVPHAIQELFPEIGFDPSKIPKPNTWFADMNNRKKFFVDYAKANGFDPLEPHNWYTQSRKKLAATLDGPRVLSYHSHSMPKALMSLFSSIGLIASKFSPR